MTCVHQCGMSCHFARQSCCCCCCSGRQSCPRSEWYNAVASSTIGELRVLVTDSPPGVGKTFRLLVPIVRDHPAAAVVTSTPFTSVRQQKGPLTSVLKKLLGASGSSSADTARRSSAERRSAKSRSPSCRWAAQPS
jgi:hypothetical protein